MTWLWSLLACLFVVGNVCGAGMFHKREGEDFSPKKNKFSFWFLTIMFVLLLGWAYTLIQLGGDVKRMIKK